MKWLKLIPRIFAFPLVMLGGLFLLVRVLWDRLRGRPKLPPAQTWIDTSEPVRRAEEAKAAVTAETAQAVAKAESAVQEVKVVVEESRATDPAIRRKALRAMARKVDQ